MMGPVVTGAKAEETAKAVPFKCVHHWVCDAAWEAVDGLVRQVCQKCGEVKRVPVWIDFNGFKRNDGELGKVVAEEGKMGRKSTYTRHAEFEGRKDEILAQLERSGWNVHAATQALGLSPSTLYSLVGKTWHIDWKEKRRQVDALKEAQSSCCILAMLQVGIERCQTLDDAKKYVAGLRLVHNFHGCRGVEGPERLVVGG